MSIRISESWKKVLEKEFESDYFKDIVQKTKAEYLKFICYPPGAKIFRAFDECSFENLKVVIIGQDPYHGCLLYTSPSPRDQLTSRMPSSA